MLSVPIENPKTLWHNDEASLKNLIMKNIDVFECLRWFLYEGPAGLYTQNDQRETGDSFCRDDLSSASRTPLS